MVGLGAPGQTTILFKLKLGETVMTLPTTRFNVDTVVHNNTSFAVWDVGGHDTTHLVWKHNLHNTHGLSTPVSPAFAAAAAPEAGDVADHPVPRQPISTDTAAPAQSTDAPVTPSHKRQRSPGTPAEGSDKAPHKLVQSSISQFGTACSTPLTSKATTTTTTSPDDNKVSSPPHKRTNSGSGANKDKNKRT